MTDWNIRDLTGSRVWLIRLLVEKALKFNSVFVSPQESPMAFVPPVFEDTAANRREILHMEACISCGHRPLYTLSRIPVSFFYSLFISHGSCVFCMCFFIAFLSFLTNPCSAYTSLLSICPN